MCLRLALLRLLIISLSGPFDYYMFDKGSLRNSDKRNFLVIFRDGSTSIDCDDEVIALSCQTLKTTHGFLGELHKSFFCRGLDSSGKNCFFFV